MPSVLAILVVLGAFFAMAPNARADSLPRTVTFTTETLGRGFTFTDDSREFRLIVRPGTFTGPVKLTVMNVGHDSLPEWKDRIRESEVYRVTVEGDNVQLNQPIIVEFAVPGSCFVTFVGKLNATGSEWEALGSTLIDRGTQVRAEDDKSTFTVAAFQYAARQEGVATYYGTYPRKTKLTMVAASNSFPLGQSVRVTNLDNGKSVSVKIVDTGAFTCPRVIDLSTPAFAKIQPTWRGVARVRVEKSTPWNTPPQETNESGDESPSGSGKPASDGSTPPATAATTSIVVDVATGEKLVGKKTSSPLPIASLTKVVTAAVFMETSPNLNEVVSYDSADNTTCSCLHLAPGERVTLKDLLFASLVGSANNATRALVRSTGLTNEQFVARMNAKAASLNLKNTSFVDPTGLEAGNVSTAEDVAVIGRIVPDSSPTIRRILSTGSYAFTSKNSTCFAPYRRTDGTCAHSFKTTNKLFGKTPFEIVAAKTGYLDEARHTFLLRARNKQGRELVLVFLRVDRKQESFAHAQALMEWTFTHYRWT